MHTLSKHQRAAAMSPETRLTELVGNFADFGSLFDRLAQPNVIELGKPLPKPRYMPGKSAGSCPATHNRRLLGDS